MNSWIDVKEDLPQSQKMVLIAIKNSHRGPVEWAYLDFTTREFMIPVSSSIHWCRAAEFGEVTHWMELPEPPWDKRYE